ncbi:MAG: DUF2807 domain-containing protein [Spirochaetaceae bacterium]|nr:DUF2807 domain-containing protein [Spirochaetaceae bacterium]
MRIYRKTHALLILFLLASVVLYSEGQIDADFIQKNYEFSDFDSLAVHGYFRVRVIKSESWDILISCSREDEKKIKLRRNNNIFEISYREGSLTGFSSPVIIISMPQLRSVDLSGSVQMEAGGFSSSSNLEIHMEAGSFLNLNGIECTEAHFSLNGSCELHAFLSARSINIDSQGNSIVRMGGRGEDFLLQSEGPSRFDGSLLLVDNVDLRLTGLCEVRITPDIQMTVSSTDMAIVYYSDKYMDVPPVVEGDVILRKY